MDRIKLVAFDCDGVLTDNKLFYSNEIRRGRFFNTSDGVACSLLKKIGMKIIMISSATEQSIHERGMDMGVDYVLTRCQNKLSAIRAFCKNMRIILQNEVVYVGNDINDIEVLKAVGFPFCPADAESEVRDIKGINILSRKGGEGVLREFVQILSKFVEILYNFEDCQETCVPPDPTKGFV